MMRKKILSLSLLLSLFAVAGCGKTSDSVPTNPTDTPSAIVKPSDKPTEKPTETPTVKPTEAPTQNPTAAPSVSPSERKTIKLSGLSYATIGEQVTLTSSVEGVSYTSSNTLAATVADGVLPLLKQAMSSSLPIKMDKTVLLLGLSLIQSLQSEIQPLRLLPLLIRPKVLSLPKETTDSSLPIKTAGRMLSMPTERQMQTLSTSVIMWLRRVPLIMVTMASSIS